MNYELLEVIIPIKDRVEVKQCVGSLLNAENLIKNIILVDGGSIESACLTVLDELEKHPKIKIISCPELEFNKSRLLNQGIKQATNEILLISDADIIWNPMTLQNLFQTVSSSSNTICSIRDVQESQLDSVALHRERYTYTIDWEQNIGFLKIMTATETKKRPGCGLICAKKSSLLELGGYKEIFRGWGWEDQDLLIRANLLGFQVYTQGYVLHLSHCDSRRNLYNDNLAPVQTRNQNILLCIQALIAGHFHGNLLLSETQQSTKDYPKSIQVQLPKELKLRFE